MSKKLDQQIDEQLNEFGSMNMWARGQSVKQGVKGALNKIPGGKVGKGLAIGAAIGGAALAARAIAKRRAAKKAAAQAAMQQTQESEKYENSELKEVAAIVNTMESLHENYGTSETFLDEKIKLNKVIKDVKKSAGKAGTYLKKDWEKTKKDASKAGKAIKKVAKTKVF